MPHLYFNSYAPLAISPAGRAASLELNIPPFVDGSIRREPDLEHRFPSISCLCRAGKFAPRLGPGDVVVYLSKKNRYGACEAQRHLTAVLEVLHKFGSHEAAAAWYCEQDLPLPNNCLVPGNDAKPFYRSHRRVEREANSSDAKTHRQWDRAYHDRAKLHPQMVVCKPLFVDLTWDSPIVTDDDLTIALDHVPGMQNPGRLPLQLLDRLAAQLGLSVRPSSH